ncbi:peptidase M16 [Salimicrobium jeotgali]|uniref:M16 family peptidase n=1 Tax=Salimicrobium jeotgali TaxID=1230341 RepID=K2GQU0_9BACI|nr:pitrilysin family protein [Salimicrobium jeotgali]AKG04528.1 peptidase M16 [Salimicrobium jeotgali]EKE32739.1 M16 family peptidase [Salimicrobium jeotgali]MBM7695273.1 putative Zn-dependent peptidase [Salimicrobium jeotgali]
MKTAKQYTEEQQGYRLHVLPTNKYKTVSIVVKWKAPLEKETITRRALLPSIMEKATENFPSARKLQGALEDLYGTALSADASKKGENHVITFRMEVVNDRYLKDEDSILKKALHILNDVLFHPKSEGEGFSASVFKREKETLAQRIRSIKDDKMSYANTRLLDHMCEDEAYGVHGQGHLEDLEPLTNEELYSYYKNMLQKDELDVYITGDVSQEEMIPLFNEYFLRHAAGPAPATTVSDMQVEEPREIIEREEMSQGKLHIGFRTHTFFGEEDYYALQVFNGIFGGFPSSKLFMNVREKHSLAYYAASRFESHKGLMFVFSGIDPADYDQAKTIILDQKKAIEDGDFTNEDVEEAKQQIIHQLKETMEHPYGLIEILYHQQLSGRQIEASELFERLEKVSREDVVRIAKKIELDTVYFLTSLEKGDA